MIIENKGIYKLIQNGEDAMMHFIFFGGKYYSLTLGSSEKAESYKKSNKIDVEFVKGGEGFKTGTVSIIDREDFVRDLFDKMTELKFNWFKEFNSDIVALEIEIA